MGTDGGKNTYKDTFLRTVIGSVYLQHDVRESQMVQENERWGGRES